MIYCKFKTLLDQLVCNRKAQMFPKRKGMHPLTLCFGFGADNCWEVNKTFAPQGKALVADFPAASYLTVVARCRSMARHVL